MSPAPVYRSVKDVRNAPLWNPTSLKLRNVEDDDAGKLKAFRAKFGRGWDADGTDVIQSEESVAQANNAGEDSKVEVSKRKEERT
jgi:hypothetical protein